MWEKYFLLVIAISVYFTLSGFFHAGYILHGKPLLKSDPPGKVCVEHENIMSLKDCVISMEDACLSYNKSEIHATLWIQNVASWSDPAAIPGTAVEEVHALGAAPLTPELWSSRVVAFSHHPNNIGHSFVDALVPFYTYLQEVSEALTVFVAPRASRLGWVGAIGMGRSHTATDGWTLGMLKAILSHHCQEHKTIFTSDLEDGQRICGRRVDFFLNSCEASNKSRQSAPFSTSTSLPKVRQALWLDLKTRYKLDLSARWNAADKILFYSRKDAGRRRVANDVEIFTALVKATKASTLGQVVDVRLSELTFEEQAYQFSVAKVFICPFGAHAVNAVFMKPGSVVVELYPGCSIDGDFAEINVSTQEELIPVEMRYLWEVMTNFRRFYADLGLQHYVVATCSSKRAKGLWDRKNLNPSRKAVGRQIRFERDMQSFSMHKKQIAKLSQLVLSLME